MTIHTRQYRFFSATLAITGTPEVLESIGGRLRYFPAADGEPDVRFDFRTLAPGATHAVSRPDPSARRRVLKSDEGMLVEFLPDQDQLYMACGDRVRALCSGVDRRAIISLAHPGSEHLWTATHPIFIVALFEMLKRRGFYNLHAAAVSYEGRTVLFAGHSTTGKSTLAVACCRAGFSFMSDDYVFLSDSGAGLRVHAFPEELDLLDETVAMFPELRGLLRHKRRPGWPKRQVRVEDFWSAPHLEASAPALLIFPTVAHTATSTLEAMEPRQAVAELVSNIQHTQPHLAQAHLDSVGELVRRSACYRLRTGSDLDRLPDRIGALIGRSASTRRGVTAS